ncbi:MAG: ABC transporter permease [Candidatus Nanosalina sp.]
MLLEFFKLSFRNIRHRGRRSWLTIIGVFIGIAAVVALVSLSQGLQNSVQEEFQSIGSNKLFINPGGSQFQGGSGSAARLTGEDIRAVRGVKSVGAAGGVLFRTTTVRYNGDQAFAVVLGMPTDDTQEIVRTSWAMEIDDGRNIRSTDTSNIVIGSAIASSTFEDDPGLRSQITVNGEEFRVVGIMKPTGDPSIDGSVIMPLPKARENLDAEENTYDWIFAKVQPGFTPEQAKKDVEQALRRSRDVEKGNEDFTVSTSEDLLQSFNSILGIVRGVVIGIASISLLVGAVGIMNTMYTSVTQRTREIGVMKAIGATRRQIMTIFMIESGIIGAIGGLLGLIVGLILSTVAAYGATQISQIPVSPYISPVLVGGSVGFAFVLGVISGVLPARRAANLEPAKALRYE